jgi:hypothetical protein
MRYRELELAIAAGMLPDISPRPRWRLGRLPDTDFDVGDGNRANWERGDTPISRERTSARGRLLGGVTFRTDDPVAVFGQAADEEGVTEARQASPRRSGV